MFDEEAVRRSLDYEESFDQTEIINGFSFRIVGRDHYINGVLLPKDIWVMRYSQEITRDFAHD